MISIKKIFCLLIFLSVPLFLLYPQDIKNEAEINKEIPVKVKRLSKRVLVLTDASPNPNVTAISTNKGIIIVDPGISWSFGEKFRRIVRHEFKRNDFTYVINTHGDRDHTFGNQAFKDAVIIGHEKCYKALQKLETEWNFKKNEFVSLHKDRAAKNIQELKKMVPGSVQANEKRRLAAANNLIAADLSQGQEIILPTQTFNDRITLYPGDITLHLYYLGEGHSDSDILVHVPQESLVVAGDAFLKDMLVCYLKQDKFDIARYSEILNTVLNDRQKIKYVVCGHSPMMTYDELLARRDYLANLLEDIKPAYTGRLDLGTVIQRFPLDNYSFLTRLIGKVSAELNNQHTQIIEKYWSQLQGEEPNEQ